MTDELPPDDPLEAVFSGKRHSPRLQSGRLARAEGTGGSYEGRVLDISQGGLLFAVDDPAFYQGEADGLARVQRAFDGGLEVAFLAEGIRITASVVRITPDSDGQVAIGCRFERSLLRVETVLLGVRAGDLDYPEALADELPYVSRPGSPVSLLLFAEGSEVAGPRCLCRVAGLGTRIIEGSLVAPQRPPAVLVTTLLGQPLAAAVVKGVNRLWEGSVELFECRLGDGEAPTPILRLLTHKDVSRQAQRSLR